MSENMNLTPMEMCYYGTGKLNLNAVAAQIVWMEEQGYLKITDTQLTKAADLPEDAGAFNRVLFNGLFYKTDSLPYDNVYAVVGRAIEESIRYLEFGAYHKYRDKKFTREISAVCDAYKDMTPGDALTIYALGKAKKFEGCEGYDFAKCELVQKVLGATITKDLKPLNNAPATAGILGVGGAALAEVEKFKVDWEYLAEN